jgi:ubiquinone/menaquinone biosynthesis C-methylase UbiE
MAVELKHFVDRTGKPFRISRDAPTITSEGGETCDLTPQGFPIFSRTGMGVEDFQGVFHVDNIDLETQYKNYGCRNFYLDKVFAKPGRLLDLAGGSGVVGQHFQKKGFDVVLTDCEEGAISLGHKEGIPSCCILDVERPLPFRNNYFDYVFLGDCIEHLYRPLSTLLEVQRVVKVGGTAAFSFPNMGYWVYRARYLLQGEVPPTETLGLEPWMYTHIRFFNQRIFTRFLKEGGFSKADYYPVVKPGSRLTLINRLGGELFPGWFGQDLLAVAKKPS